MAWGNEDDYRRGRIDEGNLMRPLIEAERKARAKLEAEVKQLKLRLGHRLPPLEDELHAGTRTEVLKEGTGWSNA